MRAAFKAVMDGKQVAFLAPTTVLAFQHVKTLRERFAGFPVRIDMVSRFRTKGEIEADARRPRRRQGGHHRRHAPAAVEGRRCSSDLGLLVVDEEQRFGVAHKERIKQMRKQGGRADDDRDADPADAEHVARRHPRHVGHRDAAEGPPRRSRRTSCEFDQQVIARAIRNELERGGQVYFVHNRVESIYSIADLLQPPRARGAHRRRPRPDERGRARARDARLRRAASSTSCVATTIVENGLDIPNANTIIINRADRYGLVAALPAARPRRPVRPPGLRVPPRSRPSNTLSPVARKRLAAIREFSDLGSGFRVAALDLEIRGAGNLLGGEQSGHIEAVGFEMYMKLLERDHPRAEGRGDRGRDARDGQPRRRPADRRDVRPRHEPAADALPASVAGARSDEELDARRSRRSRTATARCPRAVRNLADYGRDPGDGGPPRHRNPRPRGLLVVFTFRARAGRARAARRGSSGTAPTSASVPPRA